MLYFLKFPVVGGGHIELQPRPETILGDVGVMVNQRTRYKAMIGKQVKLPITERIIPIIADEYGHGVWNRAEDHAAS